MIGWTQLLRTRKFEATAARALETIDRTMKSLAQLTEDVLDGRALLRCPPYFHPDLVPVIEAALIPCASSS